ncbi:MAG TPA: 1-deoxy-D-xylulose-5-phosphate reductoisomerase, partial [Aquifex sp.]|nr:1-deoxy-D-xylulose-5-phosphate reductoisomerase [Aquifex sp.]
MESLALLGSTGSIGTQTLDLVSRFPDRFRVVLLSARRASEKLLEQARRFNPSFVITEETPPEGWAKSLPKNTKHLTGLEGLAEALAEARPDRVLNAISGIYGIEPTFLVLEKTDSLLLLANKESVLAAGEFLKPHLKRVIPVDSEHNALFQILENLPREAVKKIYLTASGGPFFGKTLRELEGVSPEEALKHPRWRMGKKITVDSATLMNKGFEVIEAKYLFGIPLRDIEVAVHPQSAVHGMVETVDGGIFALMSPTDMRFPIHHALFYPERVEIPLRGLDIFSLQRLEFFKPDTETFRCLELAYRYGERGLPHTALLVGADEGAVELFLKGELKFTRIPDLIEEVVERL